ncbi:MAG TPA: ATP-binding protein [Opitutaceae bacterium]
MSGCDREPIHVPGSIQPHGFLVVIDENTQVITHASENVADFLFRPLSQILEYTAKDVFGDAVMERLRLVSLDPFFEKKPLALEAEISTSGVSGTEIALVAHRRAGTIVLEGERVPSGFKSSLQELHARLESVVARMDRVEGSMAHCQLTVEEIRKLIGFDRVMIYRFDQDWHGTVVAEDRNEKLPSYLNHRFPASDIPQQARELYRLNRSRLIATCDYMPVKLVGRDGPPIDLSLSVLRSVSPVHLQYMRNMGTASSMSFSIMRGDRLWGLVSCHHSSPGFVPFAVRSAAELLTQVFSLQLTAREQADGFEHRMQLQAILTDLLARMSQTPHFAEALGVHWERALALCGATGLAVINNDACILRGHTPSEAETRALATWLAERSERWEVFQTSQLAQEFSQANTYLGIAAGVLAISLSRVRMSYVIWFRPEVVQTVIWGGDPRKGLPDARGVINPRVSFDIWKEIVSGSSARWKPEEVQTVSEFRNALVSIVLKRAEELASITEELTKANKELAAFSYSVSHDLRAPFRHIRSYAEILQDEKQDQLDDDAKNILNRILEASGYAGKLVDNLLAFAQMGRTTIAPQNVRMDAIVSEVRSQIDLQSAPRKIEWIIGNLPSAVADIVLIRQVWQNLMENAVKYSRNRDVSRIEISATETPTDVVFSVRDNGAGFDMRYVDKLFGIFQRLHRSEEFEGTGIGLANVRRVIERHGGKVWAQGQLNVGATFSFSLPKQPLSEYA